MVYERKRPIQPREMSEFHGNQHTQNEYDGYGYDDLFEGVRNLAEELERVPTTRDAMEADTLPCLAKIYDIVDGSWQDVLEDAGVGQTQVERYGPDERPKMVADIRSVWSDSDARVVTTREYDEKGSYPTSVVKEYFGSWANACDGAGVERGLKHGTRCRGPSGATLDSKRELEIEQFLDGNDIDYVVHPPIEGTNWVSDFYLPDSKLWIEVTGYDDGDRPNADSFDDKLGYFEENEMEVAVVSSVDDLAEFRRKVVLGSSEK